MQRTIQLKTLHALDLVPALSSFSKLPNSIMADEKQNLLVLRDYAANVKKELHLLEMLENEPAN